jgi:hypothetical protein
MLYPMATGERLSWIFDRMIFEFIGFPLSPCGIEITAFHICNMEIFSLGRWNNNFFLGYISLWSN